MEIVLFILLLIVIALQIVILTELKPKKSEDFVDDLFDETSPYVDTGSPFYTNKYMAEEKKGDK